MEVKVLNSDKKNLEFEVKGADQILLRMLVEKLNADKEVEFAAYKMEHITLTSPIAIVRTKNKDALTLVLAKLEEMKDELAVFKKQFKDATK